MANLNKTISDTALRLGEVRFSYVNVFSKRINPDGTQGKYSVCVIIPKSNTKALEKIRKAIELTFNDSVGFFGGKLPKVWKNPLRDGDTEKEDEAYNDSMFLSANSQFRPGVVDKDCQPIIDPEEFYSGCYGNVSINFYPFNVNGNKGIACGLCNIQKVKDGERLGGNGASAEEDFKDIEDDDDLM